MTDNLEENLSVAYLTSDLEEVQDISDADIISVTSDSPVHGKIFVQLSDNRMEAALLVSEIIDANISIESLVQEEGDVKYSKDYVAHKLDFLSSAYDKVAKICDEEGKEHSDLFRESAQNTMNLRSSILRMSLDNQPSFELHHRISNMCSQLNTEMSFGSYSGVPTTEKPSTIVPAKLRIKLKASYVAKFCREI